MRATDELWTEAALRPHPRIIVNSEPPRRVPNAVRTFWVNDSTTGEQREITARLRVQKSSVAMWMEEGVWHDIRQLEKAAELFDTHIYPTIQAVFGSEWNPGIDRDPHIHILHATGLGEDILGYTSPVNEYPRELYPDSNEAEMMAINIDRVDVGSPVYNALLARQLQRLVQWHQDANEERWVKEGLAELAVGLTGFQDGALERRYQEQTDTPLTTWTGSQNQRGAAYLFFTYFHQRFGDAGTRTLTSEPASGMRGIADTLEKLETDTSYEDLLTDWLAANYLDIAAQSENTAYSYSALDLKQITPAVVHDTYPVREEMSVEQFGVDYILLRRDGDLQVEFTGQTQTSLLATRAHSGQHVWWSAQADHSHASLVHAFDLRKVSQATLTYWTWYDLEAHHDYVVAEISTSDGAVWAPLAVPSGTNIDARSDGTIWGYTGKSPGWTHEELDLSDYAGRQILLRFSYLTDEAVTREGFLLDDIAVPEIGYQDDAESGIGEWRTQGFVLTDGIVSQRYIALLIDPRKEIPVQRLPLREDQSGIWTIPLGSSGSPEVVLAISGIAPLTDQPTSYELLITQ